MPGQVDGTGGKPAAAVRVIVANVTRADFLASSGVIVETDKMLMP